MSKKQFLILLMTVMLVGQLFYFRISVLPRPESGVSLASGVYEEIPEVASDKPNKNNSAGHIYENLDLLKMQAKSEEILSDPPPLPRRNELLANW